LYRLSVGEAKTIVSLCNAAYNNYAAALVDYFSSFLFCWKYWSRNLHAFGCKIACFLSVDHHVNCLHVLWGSFSLVTNWSLDGIYFGLFTTCN